MDTGLLCPAAAARQPLPQLRRGGLPGRADGWELALTDIVGSAKAIAAARY